MQAADFLIQHGARQPRERKVNEGANHAWSGNLFYDSTHLVLEGERKAVCGASATVWTPELSESNRSARCMACSGAMD